MTDAPNGDLRLAVENIGRRTAESRVGLESAISIWRRMRGEVAVKGAGGGGGGGGDADDDDDFDMDDDDMQEGPETIAAEEETGDRWLLHDVSFTASAGEGIAIVGGRGTGAGTVLRVLDRMLSPDRGRIEIFGRPTRTSTYNITIAQPDASFREQAEALAYAAAVPRRARRAWIADLVDFALRDADGNLVRGEFRQLMVRIGIAASVDPTADLLLIDDLPLTDPDFGARCIARAREAMARGAAVVIGGADVVPMLEICTRAVRLDGGVIVEEGEAGALIESERRRVALGSTGRHGAHLAGFDGRAAILATRVQGRTGTVELTFELETAAVDVELTPRLVLRRAWGGRFAVLRHGGSLSLPDPGLYRLTCLVTAPDDAPPFQVDIIADVSASGIQSEIGRTGVAVIGGGTEVPVIEGADVDVEGDTGEPALELEWRLEVVETR